jgi:hypothetical protein
MTLPNAIAALAASWDDVIARLAGEQRLTLADLMAEVLAGEDDIRGEAALDIMSLLSQVLPPGHPVRRAFAAEGEGGGERLAPAAVPWDAALAALRPRAAQLQILVGAGPGPGSRVDRIRQGIEAWLLSAPALDPPEVRRRGGDPQDPGLIRLDQPGAGVRFPAFQFGADGQPRPVVAIINRLLNAEDDPWGVADWWLGVSAWVGAAPADVLGQVDDQLLIEAARAVSEEV